MPSDLITCETHGLVLGYVVCVHVLAGAHVDHFVEATADEAHEGLGEALCADCNGQEWSLPDGTVDPEVLALVKLVCAPCLYKILGPSPRLHKMLDPERPH